MALAAGSLGYATCGVVFATARLPLWPLVGVAIGALATALVLMPRLRGGGIALPRQPRWEIPARMIVATALVLGLTALAPHVGPQLSGLLATYPVFAAVLAAFSQHRSGAAASVQVLRGLLIGLFAFTGFFTVLATGLVWLGIAPAFAAATVVALVIQGCSLLICTPALDWLRLSSTLIGWILEALRRRADDACRRRGRPPAPRGAALHQPVVAKAEQPVDTGKAARVLDRLRRGQVRTVRIFASAAASAAASKASEASRGGA